MNGFFMYFRKTLILFVLLLWPAVSFADAGMDAGTTDAGPADAGMDAGNDAGMDAGTDAGQVDDMGTSADAGTADDMGAATDMGTSTDAGMGTDTGIANDAGSSEDASLPALFTVSGTAVLSTSDAASIEVVLMSEGSTPLTDYTDDGGRFAFRDISPGTYDIAVSYADFVTQSRTIDVGGNTRLDFVLFPDVTFEVIVDVTFVDGSGPVTVSARSLGREVVSEGDGDGEISFQVGAGPWQLKVESPGYVTTNLAFSLQPDRSTDEPVRVIAVLERPASPEVTSDSGCSCSHGAAGPDGALLLLLGVAGLILARRRMRR